MSASSCAQCRGCRRSTWSPSRSWWPAWGAKPRARAPARCWLSSTRRGGFALANARVVLADAVIERGWVAVTDGKIAEIGEGRPPARGDDLAAALLIPGLVELHTDHLEAHFVPRPKVYWDPMAAVVSYDGQLATCGITTVLDSLRIWREEIAEEVDGHAEILADAIAAARAGDLLRVEHFLHLRCG